MANNWHYATNGEKHGPITAAQLKELATTGKLSPDDLVWREGMTEWRKASSVKGLLPQQSQGTARSSPPPRMASRQPDEPQSVWEQPAVIALLCLFCFPVGLLLLWKKYSGTSGVPTTRSISKNWVVIGACVLGVMVIFGMVVTVSQTSAARKEIAEADTLWEQGQHNEAVAIYQSVITSRGPFIPSDQKPLVYGRVIDHLTESGRQQEARHVLENLNKLATAVTPLVESEPGRQLLAEIRRQKEAEKQEREAEEQREKEQQALAAATRNPLTLDKSGRADFLDNTASYKGKAVRTECEWIGGGLRSRSTGRMTVLELDVWHTSGLFHVNVRVPEELEIPNIQSGDDLVVTFVCEQGLLNTGNTALKVERRE